MLFDPSSQTWCNDELHAACSTREGVTLRWPEDKPQAAPAKAAESTKNRERAALQSPAIRATLVREMPASSVKARQSAFTAYVSRYHFSD
jgi:hypothetical protein